MACAVRACKCEKDGRRFFFEVEHLARRRAVVLYPVHEEATVVDASLNHCVLLFCHATVHDGLPVQRRIIEILYFSLHSSIILQLNALSDQLVRRFRLSCFSVFGGEQFFPIGVVACDKEEAA